MFDQTLDLFKVIVIDADQALYPNPYIVEIEKGFVTNFVPTQKQKLALSKAFQPIPVTTLFSVQERKTADISALLTKQILHYIEIYGLDSPGLFNLEVTEGHVAVIANIKGVTKAELGVLVQNLIYTNAPIRKLDDLIEIIRFYSIPYDLSKVANNEARIRLYREGDKFASGDDAVRYIVYKTTNDSLLIKSKKVIAAVKAGADRIPLSFLMAHENQLAAVWNRHKPLLMALKSAKTASTINHISRFSKELHAPITLAINKTFIAQALKGTIKADGMVKVLRDNITLRDKFKYLNLIEWRMLGRTDDVFVIRNGRSHLANNRPVWSRDHLEKLQSVILASVDEDLGHLAGKTILLDPHVNYGLPSSQKQMLGNLPFGTEISVGGDTIVSGVYWEDRWGARDLDLSAIDESGNRTGWGQYSGYDRNNPITFSGDITSAPNGAMEFMTSAKSYSRLYGLYINIFNGKEGSECELVVGHQAENKSGNTRHGYQQRWITDPVVREKFSIGARGCIMGFIRDGQFVVYSLQTSNSRVSGSEITKRLIAKAMAPAWTIARLLDAMGIKYDIAPVAGKKYDYDLSYSGFSVDKLEDMLYNR